MIKRAIFFIGLLGLGACASSNFSQFGSSVLSSTGLVSGSQADAIFNAGGKLAKAATGLDEKQEYYLGRGVSATVLSKYEPLKNPAVQAYVNKVGKAVAAFSDRPEVYNDYHFLVLATPELNAISAPGGFVFITKGFLDLISDEEELASVLAHEVGHVVLGHGVKAIKQANLTEALTIIGKEAASSAGNGVTSQLTAVFGDSVKDVADTLLTKGYSRSQEYDADKYAAQLLKRAGYNQHALVAMLNALEAKGKASEKAGSDKAGSGWASTHPAPDDRRDELEDVVSAKAETVAGQQVRTARFRSVIKRQG